MDITITPGKLKGEIRVIPSKSMAHRLLICAAFSDQPTQLVCPETNRDIEATVDCLRSLGAYIQRTDSGYEVAPITQIPGSAVLDCCESGSTLRFMLPIAGALGVNATFVMEGRLPERPLSPLWEEMERMGCKLTKDGNTINCQGKLRQGHYTMDGSVSSQFITGLLFAHWIMDGCTLEITGNLESKPYIVMTQNAIARFGDHHSPGYVQVEGDWSNGAFWIAAQFLENEIWVTGLDNTSSQGDRAVVDLIPNMKTQSTTIDASDIPDLVPILSVVAASNHGATFTNIQRLRLKESDRVASTVAMLESLGGKATSTEDKLTIHPCRFIGGIVDAMNDHRIAMSAAIAATSATGPVTIKGAECVKKSYPKFWDEYSRLGGNL